MQGLAWNFCSSGANSGEFNMWFDELLARRLIGGIGLPTVRVYQWNPWAISVGQHQSLSDIDLQRCQDDGIDVVRRPTGGRAILHAEELTYSVVMWAGRKGILEVYNDVSRALVEGLRIFGVDASLQRSQPNFSELYKSRSSAPCFSSSARYEIEWRGRKLVGSAQRRYSGEHDDVVLQHGSILCGTAHRRLAEYVQSETEPIKQQVQADLNDKTTDLSEIVGKSVDVTELSCCLKQGFERMWDTTFTDMDFMTGTGNEIYA